MSKKKLVRQQTSFIIHLNFRQVGNFFILVFLQSENFFIMELKIF